MNKFTRPLSKLLSYIKEQLTPFEHSTVCPPLVFVEGVTIVFWWAAPAMVAVWLITYFKRHLPLNYLDAAISDGIGPHLWNIVSMLGLALFGLAVLLPRCKFIANSAYQVLVNTYAMGGLAIGLLVGQVTTQLPSALSKLALWKAWLSGTGIALVMLGLFALNFSLWCLASLMRTAAGHDGFLRRIERIDLRLRFLAFVLLSILPTIVFVVRGH
ncbi:hypothetical protein [Burkholderia contaminans]|uniref:hypothetical protein n=1 Tax=Burkholderia contaminans TaxID=488447 RepID=UPI001582BC78|nr:hypothetical protein [Burkholderia contaminans]MCA8157757.1 hypothetical protein [Burkholderia contaminans]